MPRTDVVRRQLIALNSGRDLARDSICRLAQDLRSWVGIRRPSAAQAERLGVPAGDLMAAQRLARRWRELASRQLRRAADLGIDIVTCIDSLYPPTLRELDLPPPVLYCRGQLPTGPAIGIVGSRRATPQAQTIGELFGRELAGRGLTVVSGFARGVDLAAHRGALLAEGGRTVAVLGCGLDVDYPRGRRSIRCEIERRGALISEFPFGTPPVPLNFPIRNRIIAALSQGVLVVEGTPRSGSLITARLALDLGREIYAIPGSILDARSAGPNALIRDGALLAGGPDDIIHSLPLSVQERLRAPQGAGPASGPSGPPAEVLEAIPAGQTVTAEDLAATLEQPLDSLLGILLELEMAGLIRRGPGAVFRRTLL